MTDVKLSDGTKLVMDISVMTWGEYKALYSIGQPDEDGDVILGKTVGLSGDEMADLAVPDYAVIFETMKSDMRQSLDPAECNEFSNGKKVLVDPYKMTRKEFKSLYIPGVVVDKDGDQILSAVSGLSVDEIDELGINDYKILMTKVMDVGRNPNRQSEGEKN